MTPSSDDAYEKERDEAFEETYFDGHACLTGDCPHDTTSACLKAAWELSADWANARAEKEIAELKAEIEMCKCCHGIPTYAFCQDCDELNPFRDEYNNKLRAEIKKLDQLLKLDHTSRETRLEEERDKLRKRCERLEKALKEIASAGLKYTSTTVSHVDVRAIAREALKDGEE